MSKISGKQAAKNAVVPPPQASTSALSAKSRQQLEDMHGRFGNDEVAAQMWNDEFSPDDRIRLGNNFAKARKKYQGTIGMAMAAWSCSRAEAVIRLCEAFQSYDPVTLKRLRREAGLQPAGTTAPSDKPSWDGHGRLSFKGTVIRKTRGSNVASNISAILDVFEAQDWPARIDDPLPGTDSPCLRATIYRLNRNLRLIRFLADGSGHGVRWELR